MKEANWILDVWASKVSKLWIEDVVIENLNNEEFDMMVERYCNISNRVVEANLDEMIEIESWFKNYYYSVM